MALDSCCHAAMATAALVPSSKQLSCKLAFSHYSHRLPAALPSPATPAWQQRRAGGGGGSGGGALPLRARIAAAPLPPFAAKAPSGDAPTRRQMELPAGDFSRVRSAEFVSSAVDLAGCPAQDRPEFALIGRSNVGKSSLINMMTQNSKLARTSKEPGASSVFGVGEGP